MPAEESRAKTKRRRTFGFAYLVAGRLPRSHRSRAVAQQSRIRYWLMVLRRGHAYPRRPADRQGFQGRRSIVKFKALRLQPLLSGGSMISPQ